VIRRLLAFIAIVVAMAVIAHVAIADHNRKTDSLRRAHRTAWLCNHDRGGCGERADQIRRARIESDWNSRERYYVSGLVLGLVGCVLLVGFEVRSRRRPAVPLV
jgi:hypothetical protein